MATKGKIRLITKEKDDAIIIETCVGTKYRLRVRDKAIKIRHDKLHTYSVYKILFTNDEVFLYLSSGKYPSWNWDTVVKPESLLLSSLYRIPKKKSK